MRYTIIGGLNGVGKSTIYSTLTATEISNLGKRVKIGLDDICSA